MATSFEDISKQRMDFSQGPNGETIATITLTLGDGSVHRFSASTDEEELDNLGAAFASAEVEQTQISGIAMSDAEIAGMFSSIGKAFKKVAKRAAKVAASKAFKAAAKGLATIAPALGPYAPAVMTVSAGMMASSQVASSALAAEAGAKRAAKKLALAAKTSAQKVSNRHWRSLLQLGAKKSKGAIAIANRARAAQTSRPTNIMDAARRGKVRSNRGGPISPQALAQAMRQGRVFWVAA